MSAHEPEGEVGLRLPVSMQQLMTVGGVVVSLIGAAYVGNYRLKQVEQELTEFRSQILQEAKVVERQDENSRRIHDIEDRLGRVERREDRLIQQQQQRQP